MYRDHLIVFPLSETSKGVLTRYLQPMFLLLEMAKPLFDKYVCVMKLNLF